MIRRGTAVLVPGEDEREDRASCPWLQGRIVAVYRSSESNIEAKEHAVFDEALRARPE